MDLYNLILTAKIQKGEGGGGDVTVNPLSVSSNGVYTASSGYAYSPVTVSVPQSGITPTGTSSITANGIYDVTNFASASVNVPGIVPSGTSQITSNGIYDVSNYASASVNVPQPTGTSVITSNGLYNVTNFSQASVSVPTGITPTGTSSITANGIYDITSFASVDVNVSGGGGGDHDVEDALIQKTLSGVYVNNRVTYVGSSVFNCMNGITGASFPNATEIGYYAFSSCRNLTTISFPNVTDVGNYAFCSCPNLTSVSFPKATRIGNNAFKDCSNLTTAIFLASSVTTLTTVNVFSNTPMSNSTYTGSFGSIYVPASLVSNYKTASNWSAFSSRITSYVE